jgi:hypothetical protein
MKKGLLITISAAMTVFFLTGIFLTIRTAAALRTDLTNRQSKIVAMPVVERSNPNRSEQTDGTLSTMIDESTAISFAKTNAGLAVLSGSNADLVDLNGKVAYEVNFNAGKIYVDANSGILLGDTIKISPEIAGQAAANYLKLSLYSKVDQVNLNGVNLYRVFFREGIYVYVSFKGQIISWEYTQPAYSNHPAKPNSNSYSSSEEDD